MQPRPLVRLVITLFAAWPIAVMVSADSPALVWVWIISWAGLYWLWRFWDYRRKSNVARPAVGPNAEAVAVCKLQARAGRSKKTEQAACVYGSAASRGSTVNNRLSRTLSNMHSGAMSRGLMNLKAICRPLVITGFRNGTPVTHPCDTLPCWQVVSEARVQVRRISASLIEPRE